MRGRHVTTAVTLVVLVALLGVGAVVGLRTLFSPLPPDKGSQASRCDATAVRRGQRITARQVQVSVFNAGSRSGRASATLAALHRRGFRRGHAGNAPSDTAVTRVQVWSTQRGDVAARLVARQFGRGTPVRFVDVNLGPGVDVVIGDRLKGLVHPTRRTRAVVVHRRAAACLPAHRKPARGPHHRAG